MPGWCPGLLWFLGHASVGFALMVCSRASLWVTGGYIPWVPKWCRHMKVQFSCLKLELTLKPDVHSRVPAGIGLRLGGSLKSPNDQLLPLPWPASPTPLPVSPASSSCMMCGITQIARESSPPGLLLGHVCIQRRWCWVGSSWKEQKLWSRADLR